MSHELRKAGTKVVNRMSRLFYHEHPEALTLETSVADAQPGRIVLSESPFFAGGGGQLPDRGVIRWNGGEIAVTGFEPQGGKTWIVLGENVELSGAVEAAVDPDFRQMMRELHTDTHLLNAFVYQQFNGALVTGVQMNGDGTARMDFDLPDVDNEKLRALDGAIDEPGLIRTRSVAPPPTLDGKIRIVEIAGLDRQACGGTHLVSTGPS